ncbi:MAG: ribonuclease HI family protein [bacterium]|nr:ribonuclease HI family protein [bacterium]
MSEEILLHTDGAAKGNPGPAGIGYVAFNRKGARLFEGYRYIGEATNNVAEYTAFIEGLTAVLERGFSRMRVASDSQLLVHQLHGLYKVKHPNLKPLFDRAVTLIEQCEHIEISHVPREQNAHADALANRAIEAHSGAGET